MRTNQHKQDCRRASRTGQSRTETQDEETSSWMLDHWNACHKEEGIPDPDKDFAFSVVGVHRDPLSRQIEESIRINRALDIGQLLGGGNNIINVKSLNRRGESFDPIKRWVPGQ